MKIINWADEVNSSLKQIILKGIKDLNNEEIDKNILIHESRKRVKNLRAILKVIKEEIGYKNFSTLNNQLKNLNRTSAAIRRNYVMYNIVHSLLEDINSDEIINLLNNMKLFFEQNISNEQSTKNLHDILSSYHDTFIQLEKEFLELKLKRNDFTLLWSGLAFIYNNGKKFNRLSIKRGEVTLFHELRKSAKDLFYVLEFVQKCWQPVIKPYYNQIKILTEHIGIMHDYYEFRIELMNPIWNSFVDAREILNEKIINKIEAKKIISVQYAEKIYAEKTDAFVRRLSKLSKFKIT